MTKDVLKVSSKSNPNKVAHAIKVSLSNSNEADIKAIGAGVVNQTVKAIAIAQLDLSDNGKELYCIPGFETILINGQEITVLNFAIKKQPA